MSSSFLLRSVAAALVLGGAIGGVYATVATFGHDRDARMTSQPSAPHGPMRSARDASHARAPAAQAARTPAMPGTMPGTPGQADAGAIVPGAKALGDTTADLTFTPVQPCRILDTRIAGGPIAANGTRSFVAAFSGNTGSFAAQGGSGTPCNVAGIGATAVMINLTVVTPNAAGYATVYPFGTAQPVASSVNYTAGAIVNNSVIVRIPSPQVASDFTLYTFAQAHFVADIVGVFSPPQATALQCTKVNGTTTTLPAGLSTITADAPACPAGYTRTQVLCEGVDAPAYARVFVGSRTTSGCRWTNESNTARTVSANSQCCRVPGR